MADPWAPLRLRLLLSISRCNRFIMRCQPGDVDWEIPRRSDHLLGHLLLLLLPQAKPELNDRPLPLGDFPIAWVSSFRSTSDSRSR